MLFLLHREFIINIPVWIVGRLKEVMCFSFPSCFFFKQNETKNDSRIYHVSFYSTFEMFWIWWWESFAVIYAV